MAGLTECWVTTGFDEEQCINALVLAKSLKRVMTLRQLVIFLSPSVPHELGKILQTEFDVCIRLDEGTKAENAMVHCWSLVKWNKIIFLGPHSLVVRNCDQLFKLDGNGFSSDFSMFLITPSLDTWASLTKVANGGPIGNDKIVETLSEKSLLDVKFNRTVDLLHGSLATNLDEIHVVSFNVGKPLEILYENNKEMIAGFLEKEIMNLWETLWKNEVVQSLKGLTSNPCNGVTNCLQQYKMEKNSPPTPDLSLLKDSIAIVGMSCRFPEANNLDEFWKLLMEGGDAMGPVPQGRWVPERCVKVPEDAKNSIGGFLNFPLDEFDGKFFGMSPAEMAFMDPQQRLTLQVAWEALEDAGINPLSLNNTFTGVFGGAWRLEYQDILQKADAPEEDFVRLYLGNSYGAITARISHCLGLTGPSVGTESGCSSSMVAVDLACKSLAKGETDLSLACGVNLLLRPFTGRALNTILAADGHCKTFDESADGFARAEGCGVLVLKRYPDAVKDGDRIWGLIRGTGVVQEGASRSLGTPTKYCEALAMKLALQNAKVEPKEVSFVETHGTGTPVGDPLEVAAVAEVYSKGRTKPLIIGSVKTNIGHTEACSGIAGIIKVILSLKNEMIPPHKNFKKLNPNINLEAVPAKLPLEAMEWKKDSKGKPRIAGVSSFGITGTDAHAIIQETPDLKTHQFSPKICLQRPSHILTLSAKTPEALEQNLENFKIYLKGTDEKFEDIAHTSNIGRGDFPFRAFVVGNCNSDVMENMKNVTKSTAPEDQPKVCFLFTGQGSQYPGMAKSLYDHNPTFKVNFDICDAHLNETYGISIREALWGSNTENISRTIYSQTSIFCVEFCLLKLWESWGVKPDLVLGHSLGEFGAAVAAGILSFEDALKLVGERSRLIDELPGGRMLVLKEKYESVKKLLDMFFNGNDKWLDFAAINSPDQTVLAGSVENIQAFSEFCKTKNIKSLILEATHAFHSRHMDPILEDYWEIASSVKYSKPTCVYVSGMEGRVVEEESHVNADYWVRHTRESVQFLNASKAILGLGCNLFLEIGPQPVLSAMTMINSDEVPGTQPVYCLPSIRKQDEDWQTVLTSLGKLYLNGVNVNWKRFDQFENLKVVTAPFYPFNGKTYWYDIPDQGPGQIHPLVGTPLSNPSNSKIFKNKIKLDSLKFLKDHVIGNKIVYPGAGFLEMCLVAGHAASQCTETGYFDPPAPITLENFAIESPLGLEENANTELQTVVTSEDSGETKVTIYSKLTLDKETQKWIRHASATFYPYAIQTKEEDLADNRNLKQMLKRCGKKIMVHDTYQKLSSFGLKFGPTFKSLTAMWKGKKEVCFEVKVPESNITYVCHPVVLDALFQAIMIAVNPNIKQLHVPVSVTKLVWFSKMETEKCYIHCAIQSNDAIAILYDQNGQIIAKMIGATLLETTVSTIMSSLEAQRVALPSLYENTWKPQIGPLERRTNLLEPWSTTVFQENFKAEAAIQFNPLDESDQIFNEKSNKLYGLYMIKSLYDLGWAPQVGMIYHLKEMVTSFKIKPSIEGFFRYVLMTLCEDGLFKVINADREKMSFELMQAPTNITKVMESIDELYTQIHPMSPTEVEIVAKTGLNLSNFLTGKASALPILFPEDSSKLSADTFYREAKIMARSMSLGKYIYAEIFSGCRKMLKERKGLIRILEVGAGTGSTTEALLPFLDECPEGYEYTYTDISPAFFHFGSKVFDNSKVAVSFRILDIEKDITSQGFIPHHYDIILANNVIHATKSISDTIGNLRNALRGNGLLLITESLKPSRNINLLFGPLDGYWLFKDYELRPYNCEISLNTWKELLITKNFKEVACYPCFDNGIGIIIARNEPFQIYHQLPALEGAKRTKTWIIFSDQTEASNYFYEKLVELGNQVVIVTRSTSTSQWEKRDDFSYSVPPEEKDVINLFQSIREKSKLTIDGVVFLWGLNHQNSDYAALCKPFLSICKLLIPEIKPKLFVLTKGIISGIGDHGVSHPVPSLLWGMTKSFQNEKPDSICRCIDLEELTLSKPSLENLNEAFSELFLDDREIFVAFRGKQRNVSRLVPWKVQHTELSLPKCERFRLILAPTKTINDLRFGPMGTVSVGNSEIEICVKAYALNFRDVLTVLKPSLDFENFNTVGLDFSGVITAVGSNVTLNKAGDAVLGCNLHGDSLASHLVMNEGLVINKPQNMTFNDAATLPAVATTAVLCLIQVAQLTKDDTILIHTASGGVGLVAVQIAQSVGATIIATAGSQRKRNYLKNLGIKHIFHSRNANYEQDIRLALNGRGVDVVLNSLTSAGFKEASLNVCNQGARFIEMSKLNTWTVEEVKALRPDVKYEMVDLSASTETQMRDLMTSLRSIMEKGMVTSIPYVRFDVSEIREALTFLQKAKHIGKIVCVMPDTTLKSSSENKIPMFNMESTYLITGGLGGIGFEVCKWMLKSGAKNIALVGRNPPKDGISSEIKRLNSEGFNVLPLQYDVGDMDQCQKLLEILKSSEINVPPLRGIMHAAGVIADAVFENQNWKNYEKTYNPKVSGGWNLHECTLNYQLEHFVMFSSIAACMGTLGQSNHVSANFYLDSLTAYRNSIGLPATTINWGQWGQVGVAANIEVVGIKPFTALQGISALEVILKSQKTAACVFDVDFNVLRQLFPISKRYVEEIKSSEEIRQIFVTSEQFWNDYDSATDKNGREEAVKAYVRSLIRAILKLDESDILSDDEHFHNLGMDSLMMIELKNAMQAALGSRAVITVNSIKDCYNINTLAAKLTEIISGDTGTAALKNEELIKLIREDSQLPMDIKPTPISSPCKSSEIKTILMTGATGNLGPYLLKDILQKYTHVQKIYCLVRRHSNLSSQERLEEKLASKGLLDQISLEKIECIDGSITKPNLGWTQEKYSELSEKIDSIVHLAVSSDLTRDYRKTDDKKNMRAVNVLGTINILRFAFATKTKVMFHASSIVANGKLDSNKRMSECWPTPEDFDEMPDLGYPISKFICDLLIGQAAERGLPVKVFRFPVIGGESKTGKNADIDNNQLMLRLMSYLHLGYMPNVPGVLCVLPVDVCSDLSLKVFFDDEAGTDVYNVYHPYPKSETELVSIAQDIGYSLEIVDGIEFQKRVELAKDSRLVRLVKQALDKENKGNQQRFYKHSTAIVEAFTADSKNGFFSKKLAKLIPEYPNSIENTISIIKRDLIHAKMSGVMEKYGV